jgi:acetyltransferase EpsM
MTAQPVAVIGGGEHARVVIETARSRLDLWVVEGFADPDPCEETQRRLGVAWLGDDERALGLVGVDGERRFVLGVGAIGVGERRRRIVERYVAASARFASLVHARAWVSPTAQLDEGSVVFAGAVVQSGAHIGAHAVVGSGAIIEHDVSLGAFAQAGPGAVVGGGAVIGEGSYLGLGSRVRDHVAVGTKVMVAMGAVVTANVASGAVVVGVPARAR